MSIGSGRSTSVLAAYRDTVEREISRIADERTTDLSSATANAVRYSLAGGGKRLRGMLVLAAYDAAGGTGDAAGVAASVEIIHAYSLVHDDLPCMDDDDIRRGRPSAHRAFTVPVATAAGAAMIPLAALSAYTSAQSLRLPDTACCTIVKVLMQGAGAGGMIGGQLLDLAGERSALTREELDTIHAAKTGALVAASVTLGALAGGAAPHQLEVFRIFGERAGLAFQIMDDVLDVTSSTGQLGKTAGRDAVLGKSTYPALLGLEEATVRAHSLVEEGCDALRQQNLLTNELDSLAGFIVSRKH